MCHSAAKRRLTEGASGDAASEGAVEAREVCRVVGREGVGGEVVWGRGGRLDGHGDMVGRVVLFAQRGVVMYLRG